jgi:large subunit ribosomal protein L24
MHVRKGDRVVVRAGKDATGAPVGEATGEVMRVMPAKGLVIVSGLHYVRKHVRPNQRNPRGGRLEKESPIHISNVMPLCPNTECKGHRLGSRVRFQVGDDGKKHRRCARCGAVLHTVSAAGGPAAGKQ